MVHVIRTLWKYGKQQVKMAVTTAQEITSLTVSNTAALEAISVCSAKRDKNLDPRVKRTRVLLVQAFKDLMREKEFQKITVYDITELAAVNRATFYAHFEDKYNLLEQVIREHFQDMLYSRFSTSYELNEANLQHFILTAFEFVGQLHGSCSHPRKRFEPLIVAQAQVLLQEYLFNWFEQQKFAGFENKAVQEIAVGTLSWAIFGAALDWNRGAKKVTAEETVNQVLNMLTPGLNL
jgi:AcrR family transcriptional regulator